MKGKTGTKLREWQKKALLGGVCVKCDRKVAKLTVDHIIPMSFLNRIDDFDELAKNWEENYQMLCHPCNTMKAGSIDITNKKTAQLLLKIIQPYL